MVVIFYLPLALLYWQTGDALSAGTKAWLAGGVLLGVYAMGAFYLQANASKGAEQSVGVGEINRAITQLEAVTRENAGLVEAAASSSRSFQDEAHRLTQVVARFREQGASRARTQCRRALRGGVRVGRGAVVRQPLGGRRPRGRQPGIPHGRSFVASLWGRSPSMGPGLSRGIRQWPSTW